METKQYQINGRTEERAKSEKRPFRRAFDMLTFIDRSVVKDVIMKRCGISSKQHFGLLKNGQHPISIVRQDFIESTFRAFGLNAWTGEKLN